MSQNKQLGFDTVCIHGGHQLDAKRAHLTPIYATSTAGANQSFSAVGKSHVNFYSAAASPSLPERSTLYT
mgnify:CR=1 FL=1